MKILYIAVHRHKGWGAEHWLALAFERMGHQVARYDYRQKRRLMTPWWLIRQQLRQLEKTFQPDVVLLQRADNMPSSVVRAISTPVVFWSTEQLVRRRDVDQLLVCNDIFSWVYVHTYTCLDYVTQHFSHLSSHVSVLHNATGVETLRENADRTKLAIFNRNLSPRRRDWLDQCGDLVEVIQGRFGKPYFDDLSQSKISLNIHFSDLSLDDFETGIYEALACGCLVISETLDDRTVRDLNMQDVVVQVETPEQMRQAIEYFRDNPEKMLRNLNLAKEAISANLWDARAEQISEKFTTLLN